MDKNEEIVKINPQEYGLQVTEAATIEKAFIPMLEKMTELEVEFNEVINMPLEPSTFVKAKALRLKYVKVRTGTAEIHKTAKAYYLNGGRFVDGWKNAQAFASQGKETKLEQIEKHYEIQEKERKAKLKEERIVLLSDLCENPAMYPLDEMSESAFTNLVDGFKFAKQAKIDAEKKAEQERIEKERIAELIRVNKEALLPLSNWIDGFETLEFAEIGEADRLSYIQKAKEVKAKFDAEQERIRLENEKLKADAEAKEKAIAEERAKADAEKRAIEKAAQEAAAKEQARQDAMRIAEQKRNDELLEAQRKHAAKEKADAEAKLKSEREAKAKLEAELKAKSDAELKSKQEAERKAADEDKARKLAERKLAAAPDKDKLELFAQTIEGLKLPEVKTEEAKKILSDVNGLLVKVTMYIREKNAAL